MKKNLTDQQYPDYWMRSKTMENKIYLLAIRVKKGKNIIVPFGDEKRRDEMFNFLSKTHDVARSNM